MTYFLYRLLALSIMAALMGVGIVATGTTAAIQAEHILLSISMILAGVGLVLTVSRDVLTARMSKRQAASPPRRRNVRRR